MADIESGALPSTPSGSARTANPLNVNEYDIEPVPSMEDSTVGMSASSRGSQNGTDASGVPALTTWKYMWRQQVRSRTDNPHIQSFLETLFLLLVYLSTFVEGPINFLLGQYQNSNNGETTTKRKKDNKPAVTRGFVATKLGHVSYLISEARQPRLTPILCFHASPRSSDEFEQVLPILAATGRRVVALDVPGFGFSENPRMSCKIDDIADAFLKVADSLLIENFIVIGNFMGGYIATSLASRYPNRVLASIHTNLLYFSQSTPVDPDETFQEAGELGGVSFYLYEDGSHLLNLHNKRKWLDAELNLRVVHNELTFLVNRRQRHIQGITMEDISDYDLEASARRIASPVLCLRGEAALSYLDAKKLAGNQRFDTACRLLPHCEVKALSGPWSTINMINQAPEEYSSICISFLEKHGV